jgi:hypothetical protein
MKGRLSVKKILAFSLCFGLLCVLSISLVGCDSGKKKDEKGKATPPPAGTTEVKFKDIPEQKLTKKGEKKVEVELTEKAAVDINLTAKGKDDAKITGTGTVKKCETKGELTVKTDDAKAGDAVVEVTAAAEKTTGSATFKAKVE